MLLYFPLAALLGTLICLFRPFNPDNTRICGRLFSYGGLKIVGLKLELEGAEHIKDYQPGIVLANHQSNLDLFVHGGIIPSRCVSVGKKSLLFVPFFGLVYWLAGNILIDRARGTEMLRMLKTKVAAAVRNNATSVWVFPEGTRNSGKQLNKFKPGAFLMAKEADCPIYMICASRYREQINLNSFKTQVVKVKVLPPVQVDAANDDFDALRKSMHDTMQQEIDALSA